MITHGWTWTQSSWAVENQGADADGWIYAASFGSIAESGSAVKGMTHFVRRRRRSRTQSFFGSCCVVCCKFISNCITNFPTISGPSLIEGSCDHCDSREVQQLSDCMLEALTQTSLHENPGEYSEVTTNSLKNTLHELLGIASRGESFHDMAGIYRCLDKFFITIINKKSTWSKLSSIVGADYLPENLPQRAVEVSSFSFSLDERKEVARMLIRKYDTSFIYHCNKYNCGTSCIFAPNPCPNTGCSEIVSSKYVGEHLEACQFTPLLCHRGCGETVVKKEMDCHLSFECVLRKAECPYACIGCKPSKCYLNRAI